MTDIAFGNPPALTPPQSLDERVADLDMRVRKIEEMIEQSRLAQQRQMAQRLAQNPDQLQTLQKLVELAQQQQGQQPPQAHG
ncbi:hypothetical protein SEA_LITTLELAF_95 [Mycobacterium phage LittleLaf]|uniref:Uncharacterized protein n=5 Tax=Marvinvirus TaxID=1982091 RepID=A0A3S9U9E6_9CAUD|nr:hypothetical protein SEA_LITTLELAF_95 [Mycobacterium phage LittleLaf]AZS06863.1 hypothetical protein SEA_RAELA_99 [Mycobacterium phage Raela]QAX93148.1 hypothetical protein SEA_REDRAIDER77_97 [Mycobacterium phage RedRaider77]QFP94234.1 hypothetical protein SEA_JOIEB_98 [Mycobacterium phage JoieB]QFP97647.1 hypothetical protein SEA_CORAZON_92 [Mycobacterium phage Corazon]URP22590.1 hypothetical protein SEA_HUPHLEPUFF_99 [Mycobacterium phage Huphlepuff]WAA20202.1 hypothetical protein SEA_CLA